MLWPAKIRESCPYFPFIWYGSRPFDSGEYVPIFAFANSNTSFSRFSSSDWIFSRYFFIFTYSSLSVDSSDTNMAVCSIFFIPSENTSPISAPNVPISSLTTVEPSYPAIAIPSSIYIINIIIIIIKTMIAITIAATAPADTPAAVPAAAPAVAPADAVAVPAVVAAALVPAVTAVFAASLPAFLTASEPAFLNPSFVAFFMVLPVFSATLFEIFSKVFFLSMAPAILLVSSSFFSFFLFSSTSDPIWYKESEIFSFPAFNIEPTVKALAVPLASPRNDNFSNFKSFTLLLEIALFPTFLKPPFPTLMNPLPIL